MAAQGLRLAHNVTHELPRLEDLHAVELLHERVRAKESTVVAPMLSPQFICGHENRHLVPSDALAYYLEQRTVAIDIEPFVKDLRTESPVVEDNDDASEHTQRRYIACTMTRPVRMYRNIGEDRSVYRIGGRSLSI